MVAEPAAVRCTVTTPAALTLARLGFDELQVASDDTSRDVLSDIRAVAIIGTVD
jgi:hypothetical protein